MLLGQPLTARDLKSLDPELYRQLKDIIFCKTDVEDFGLTFSMAKIVPLASGKQYMLQSFGVLPLTESVNLNFFRLPREIELKEGGAEIDVTWGNVEEFVTLQMQHRLGLTHIHTLQAFILGVPLPLDRHSVFSKDAL